MEKYQWCETCNKRQFHEYRETDGQRKLVCIACGIREALIEIEDIRDALEYQRLERDTRLTEAMKPVQLECDVIQAKFEDAVAPLQARLTELESQVRGDVVYHGESVRGAGLQAVYSKPRVTWDTAGLDGYAVAHPEILAFRREGAPSVTIKSMRK